MLLKSNSPLGDTSCSHLSVVSVCCECAAAILPRESRAIMRDGSILCRGCSRPFRVVEGVEQHSYLHLVDPAVFQQPTHREELGSVGDQRGSGEDEPVLSVVKANLVCKVIPVVIGLLAWYGARFCIHIFANVKVWHATLVTWLMCERAAQERCHHRLVRLVISSFGTSAATVGKSMPLLIEIGLPPAQGITPSPIEYGILQSDPTKSYKITPRMQHAR